MREKQIFAVPTFTIFEYFAAHPNTPAQGARDAQLLDLHAQEFKKQARRGYTVCHGLRRRPISAWHAGP